MPKHEGAGAGRDRHQHRRDGRGRDLCLWRDKHPLRLLRNRARLLRAVRRGVLRRQAHGRIPALKGTRFRRRDFDPNRG